MTFFKICIYAISGAIIGYIIALIISSIFQFRFSKKTTSAVFCTIFGFFIALIIYYAGVGEFTFINTIYNKIYNSVISTDNQIAQELVGAIGTLITALVTMLIFVFTQIITKSNENRKKRAASVEDYLGKLQHQVELTHDKLIAFRNERYGDSNHIYHSKGKSSLYETYFNAISNGNYYKISTEWGIDYVCYNSINRPTKEKKIVKGFGDIKNKEVIDDAWGYQHGANLVSMCYNLAALIAHCERVRQNLYKLSFSESELKRMNRTLLNIDDIFDTEFGIYQVTQQAIAEEMLNEKKDGIISYDYFYKKAFLKGETRCNSFEQLINFVLNIANGERISQEKQLIVALYDLYFYLDYLIWGNNKGKWEFYCKETGDFIPFCCRQNSNLEDGPASHCHYTVESENEKYTSSFSKKILDFKWWILKYLSKHEMIDHDVLDVLYHFQGKTYYITKTKVKIKNKTDKSEKESLYAVLKEEIPIKKGIFNTLKLKFICFLMSNHHIKDYKVDDIEFLTMDIYRALVNKVITNDDGGCYADLLRDLENINELSNEINKIIKDDKWIVEKDRYNSYQRRLDKISTEIIGISDRIYKSNNNLFKKIFNEQILAGTEKKITSVNDIGSILQELSYISQKLNTKYTEAHKYMEELMGNKPNQYEKVLSWVNGFERGIRDLIQYEISIQYAYLLQSNIEFDLYRHMSYEPHKLKTSLRTAIKQTPSCPRADCFKFIASVNTPYRSRQKLVK